MVITKAFLMVYLLFIGFLAYAAAKHSWNRLKIGIKVMILPAFLCFGLLDVVQLASSTSQWQPTQTPTGGGAVNLIAMDTAGTLSFAGHFKI